MNHDVQLRLQPYLQCANNFKIFKVLWHYFIHSFCSCCCNPRRDSRRTNYCTVLYGGYMWNLKKSFLVFLGRLSKNFQHVTMARLREYDITLHVTTSETLIESFRRYKVSQLLQNFRVKSNMLENVHETKLLQLITAFNEG